MGKRRWPVVFVALGIGGMLFAPDDAGADVTHDRVVTAFAGGGAHAFTVEPTTRAAISLTSNGYARVKRRGPSDEPVVTIDETDPWTGAPVPLARVAPLPLDMTDPWNGQIIVAPGAAFASAQIDAEVPYARAAD